MGGGPDFEDYMREAEEQIHDATTPQTQPPADMGEMVERLADYIRGVPDAYLVGSTGTTASSPGKLSYGDLHALLSHRDDLERRLGVARGAMTYAAETTDDKHISIKLFAALKDMR